MYLKKQGIPEEGELVMCTATKVHYNSVFATVDEYDNKVGMIHISEISPGRIRNIRDFVKEGKVIVCKVLRIDRERGHIDLSLRRVTDSQRRKKVNETKQEQLAEKIIEFVANNLKLNPKKLYEDIYNNISEEYDSVYSAFFDIVEDEFSIDDLGVDKNIAQKLDEIIRQRIKSIEVEIKGELSLETYAPEGVKHVKEALELADKTSEKLQITYKGGGKYIFVVNAPEYKEAEEILKNAYDAAISKIESFGGTGEFARAN